MERDSPLDQEVFQSYGLRNADFGRVKGSSQLQPQKNLNNDIRTKITHIESLGLGILGTVQLVKYGTWAGEPACLVCLHINHRGNASSAAFRNVEVLVSCEPWDSKSSNPPVLRNFSPRQSRVRLDNDHATWGWESLQRCWMATESHSSPSNIIMTDEAHIAAVISGTPWSNKRRTAPHQILWVLNNQSEGKWQVPDQLSFAFVVTYVSAFRATVEVKAKTRIGLPFPLLATPWSRDDPLLFNGRTQVGGLSLVDKFDHFSGTDWAKAAPYLPEWTNESEKRDAIKSGQPPLIIHNDLPSNVTYRAQGLPGDCNFKEAQRMIASVLLIKEQDISIKSLAESPYRSEKTATFTTQHPSNNLMNLASEGKDEWQFEMQDIPGVPSQAREGFLRQTRLVIDTHFHGFTPYHNAQGVGSIYEAE